MERLLLFSSPRQQDLDDRGLVHRRKITVDKKRIYSFCARNCFFVLGWILLLALGLRIAALYSFNHSLYRDFLLYDERTYHDWARYILKGKNFWIYDQAALPACVMAAVYRLTGVAFTHVRVANVLFGVATCGFIFGVGRELGGIRVGLLSAAVAAIYKPFVFFSVTLLKESLGLCVFSAAVYSFLVAMRRPSGVKINTPILENANTSNQGWRQLLPILLFGVMAGLSLNVRQNTVAPLALMEVILLWARYRQYRSARNVAWTVLVLVIGLALSMTPFTVKTYRGTGGFSLTPLGGINLVMGNYLPSGVPYFRPVPFATASAREQGVGYTIEASRRAGHKLSEAEASAFWTREVIRTATLQPRRFAWRILQKALVVFNRFEEGDNYHIGFISRFIPFFRAPLPGFGEIMPLGAAALLILAWRESRARLMAAILSAYTLTLIVFFASDRIRVFMVVLLIPYTVMGLLRLLRWERGDRAWRTIFAILVIALVAMSILPIAGTGDLTAHYNAHSNNLMQKGRIAEAEEYLRASAEMKGAYSDYANLNLAGLMLSRREFQEAIKFAELIPDSSYAASGKYDTIGTAWSQLDQLDRAIAAYERSIEINWGIKEVRQKLITIYSTRDPAKADEHRRLLSYIKSFYHE